MFATPADVIAVVVIGGLIVWSVGRFMWNHWGRPCPRCGYRVKAGEMDCYVCDFDFSTIGETDDDRD